MGILKNYQVRILSVLGTFILFHSTLYAAPALLPTAVSAGNVSRVGIVAAIQGAVQITSAGQAGKVVESGQPVFLGDTISTDGKGRLQILLLDQTIFTIGPNSSIVIDQFVYDPSTHDGVVKAKVVKGVFRFVTGKIGQKKPQQMEVDLPAGTIGIRGTIVAGEVEGKQSKIVLLGPGEKNNTGSREGRFILSNESGGQIRQETVSKTGFGSIINGDGSAPTKPFQVPFQDLVKITNALGPLPISESGAQQSSQEGKAGENNRNASPTEQSGQGKVRAGEFVKQEGAVGRLVQKLGHESAQASQKTIDSLGTVVLNGPASRDQLQIAAQKLGGIKHFEKLNVPVTGTYSTGSQFANFKLDIDFGARTVGGGASKVYGDVFTGTVSTFQFDLATKKPFGFGAENAVFLFNNLPLASGSCGVSCDSADVIVGINNKDGNIASDANMGLIIFDGGVNKAQAVTVAPRLEGPST